MTKEEDNTFKMSIPMFTNAELTEIDNNLDTFVSQLTKQIVHEKETVIVQHIMQKQQEEIEKHKKRNRELESTIKNALNFIVNMDSEIYGISNMEELRDILRCNIVGYDLEVENLKAENQKKDKIINEMAKYIEKLTVDLKIPIGENMIWNIEDIKQCFEKKVEDK